MISEALRKNPFQTKVNASLDWLKGIVFPNDIIEISDDGRSQLYRFTFPLFPRQTPKKILDAKSPTFFIADSSKIPPKKGWLPVYVSPTFSLWEHQSRFKMVTPLRHGFAIGEKRAIYNLAREVVTNILSGSKEFYSLRKPPTSVPRRLTQKGNVCTRLWIDGEVRGTGCSLNDTFWFGLVLSVRSALLDQRHRPIEGHEIPKIIFQVSNFDGPDIPLGIDELSGECDIGHAYLSDGLEILFSGCERALKDSSSQEVFGFQTRQRILSGDIRVRAVQRQEIFCGETSENTLVANTGISEETLLKRAEEGVLFIDRMCYENGGIRPYFDLRTKTYGDMDWVRNAFSAYALAEFAHAVGHNKSLEIARREYFYLKRYLLDLDRVVEGKYLALIYLAHLSISLSENAAALSAARIVVKGLPSITFEPILYCQLLTLLVRLKAQGANDFEKTIRNLQSRLMWEYSRFVREPGKKYLMPWMELPYALKQLDESVSREILSMLAEFQLFSGGFSSWSDSIVAYSRISAKMFEVMGSFAEYEHQSNKLLTWILSMQELGQLRGPLPTAQLELVRGAFPDFEGGGEYWIDGVAHFLLGVGRYLDSKKDPK